MEGQKDEPVQDVEEMMEIINKYGGVYKYIINDGIGHWYPDDLEDKLDDALAYIFS